MEQSWQTLERSLVDSELTHRDRLRIGARLAATDDPRPGTGMKDGVPDIAWLPVGESGEVEIKRVWLPESPNDEARVVHRENVPVEPFYIAQYLVTHAQYQAFVEAEDGFDNLTWWDGIPDEYQLQPLSEQRTKKPNNPRDGVSWYQSVAFARWMNHRLGGFEVPHPSERGTFRVGENAQVRLPTEWEWQWAAQNGAEARTYPWGEAKRGYANTVEAELKQAIAVGMYPHGAAACGALDMAGNLMEWCANDKANLEVIDVTSAATKVLRGGDWGYGLTNASCQYCDDDAPERVDVLNGFRLVIAPDNHDKR